MKIAPDKWKHFYAGIVMGAVLQAFFSFLLDARFGLSALLAFIFSVVIGYGFELFSKFTGKGHYELMDAVAALVGAVLGIGSVALIQLA
jgi:VanZ family protein